MIRKPQLVHYADHAVGAPFSVEQRADPDMKPRGLWLSDDGCKDNWPTWCRAEDFNVERLSHAHDVMLAPHARILHLDTPTMLAWFSRTYGANISGISGTMHIDWSGVARLVQGILISPYHWSCRYDEAASWYYSWDCASGCIWDATAIASLTLREQVERAA